MKFLCLFYGSWISGLSSSSFFCYLERATWVNKFAKRGGKSFFFSDIKWVVNFRPGGDEYRLKFAFVGEINWGEGCAIWVKRTLAQHHLTRRKGVCIVAAKIWVFGFFNSIPEDSMLRVYGVCVLTRE